MIYNCSFIIGECDGAEPMQVKEIGNEKPEKTDQKEKKKQVGKVRRRQRSLHSRTLAALISRALLIRDSARMKEIWLTYHRAVVLMNTESEES